MSLAAKATVVYGLTVRSSSLVFASEAWGKLAKPLTFIGLILSRRRSDTLRTQEPIGGSAITRIPIEVWEEVRTWLVREEVADAEHSLLSDYLCDDPFPEQAKQANKRLNSRTFQDDSTCACCSKSFQDWIIDSVSAWDPERVSSIETLLLSFGLALGSSDPIPLDAVHWVGEFDLALVAFPSR
ncbi:hypothetical protein JCM16303_003012, partial [Sporobolomyces ruberrimus]